MLLDSARDSSGCTTTSCSIRVICVTDTQCPSVSREEQMRKSLLLVAAAALALGAGPALAKKQLVIVVKGLDNPFFEAISSGLREVEQRKRQLGV